MKMSMDEVYEAIKNRGLLYLPAPITKLPAGGIGDAIASSMALMAILQQNAEISRPRSKIW